MKMETIKIKTRNGEVSVWSVPFRWYKTKWGKSYEPINKIKPLLNTLAGWERVNRNNTFTVL